LIQKYFFFQLIDDDNFFPKENETRYIEFFLNVVPQQGDQMSLWKVAQNVARPLKMYKLNCGIK
jgi:hypothetical protein